jgi:hypothetical protein
MEKLTELLADEEVPCGRLTKCSVRWIWANALWTVQKRPSAFDPSSALTAGIGAVKEVWNVDNVRKRITPRLIQGTTVRIGGRKGFALPPMHGCPLTARIRRTA